MQLAVSAALGIYNEHAHALHALGPLRQRRERLRRAATQTKQFASPHLSKSRHRTRHYSILAGARVASQAYCWGDGRFPSSHDLTLATPIS